jgi:hypothetical protein
MEYKTEYYSADDNMSFNSQDNKKQLEKLKHEDRGYNKIWRNVNTNGVLKKTKIEVYTSSDFGHHIRDAETGDYYPYLVGSNDEHLFFKVGLSTGECKSRNGSSTLFYLSPEKYVEHLNITTPLDSELILSWKQRRDHRMSEKNMVSKKQLSSVVIK